MLERLNEVEISERWIMKFYQQYSVAKLAVAGLALICLMIMSVPVVYAHNSHPHTASNSYKHSTSKSESNAPATVVRHQQGVNAYKGPIPAKQPSDYKNRKLAVELDDIKFVEKKNDDDCCHGCENVFIEITNIANNKTKDKRVALSAHSESILVKSKIIVIHSGLITSLPPSSLQGALRYRVLLI